jgi:hypothetical protein
LDFGTYQVISDVFKLDWAFEREDEVEAFRSEHRRFGEWLSAAARGERGNSVRAGTATAVKNVEHYLDNGLPSHFIEKESQDGELDRLIPSVDAVAFAKLQAWHFDHQFDKTALASILAGYLYETRWIQTENATTGRYQGVFIETELASYSAWKSQGGMFDTFENRFITAVANFEEVSSETVKAMTGRLQKASESVISMQNMGSEAYSALVQSNAMLTHAKEDAASITGSVNQVISGLKADLEAASARMSALQERLATMSAKKLWDRRAKSNAAAFWISTFVLCVLLVGAPVWAIVKLDWTLGVLTRILETTMRGLPAPEGALYAVSIATRLVVTTLPIILYLWVIRLIVRFNLRSLALMDDATQRDTMMDTYFHLIEKQAAIKEDRALILAALFRPLPGQGTDNVEPPNFTEFVTKAMGQNPK